MNGLRTLRVATVLAVLVAGCGVPVDPSPRDIPAREVPFGLLDATTTTTSRPAARTTATVFLVRGDRLAPVGRQVPAPASPAEVLASVSAGPAPKEAAAGLRSALTTPVASVQVAGGVATVSLSPEFVDAPVGEQILALAQLVYTATDLAGVRGVRFAFGGRLAQVPTAQGTVKLGVVARPDYAAVAPAR